MKRVSIKQLDAIVILDSDGNRIAVKYYNDKSLMNSEEKNNGTNANLKLNRNLSTSKDSANFNMEDCYNGFRTVNDQKLFESEITEKVKRLEGNPNEAEVIMLNKYIVLCLCINDVNLYVVGGEDDNEIILLEILRTTHEALNQTTNNQIGKRQLMEKLDSVYLILDEIADSGIIMETNPNVIMNRLYMHEGEIHEHTPLNQAISSAKENIIRSLLSGT